MPMALLFAAPDTFSRPAPAAAAKEMSRFAFCTGACDDASKAPPLLDPLPTERSSVMVSIYWPPA